MPISIILLGVFIILLNFKVTERVFSRLGVSIMMLDLLSILAFLLIMIKPINFYDIIYVSLGGFLIFTSLAIYLFFTVKQNKELRTIFLGFLSAIGVSYLFDLFFPFMQEQLFDYTTVIVAITLGVVIYTVCKNLKSSFIIIFLSMPIASLINFIINRQNNLGNMLFLGTGNFFEIGVIAFTTVYLIITFKTFKVFNKTKENDVLVLSNDEVVEINKKEEIDINE